jgi:hypothetical protein
MKQIHTNPYSAHHDISLLLPWYVNNSLSGTELKSVENHLKVCLTCRRELANLQKLSLAVNQESSFDSAANISFAQLKNRIHKPDNRVPPLPEDITILQAKKNRRLAFKPPLWVRMRFALAASIAIFLLFPGYVYFEKFLNNDYRTLSDSETSKPNKNEIRVVFSKNTTQQQIDAILANAQGQIIGGPSDQSVYTVRINAVTTTNKILETLEQLRKNANVIFAEPAYALLSAEQPLSDSR